MINICNIVVLENPCSFLKPFYFQITFKTDEELKDNEYEFKVVYVGSAESTDFDQILLSESLGFYSKGQHDLILQSAPVDPNKIPKEELLQPSILFIVGYHNDKQFFQVGYIVSKEYLDDTVPDVITDYDKLQRLVIDQSPRILDDSNEENDSVNDAVRTAVNPSLEEIINSCIPQLVSIANKTI